MDKHKEALAQMAEEWNLSQGQYEQQFGGEQVEPGVYEARLQSSKIRVSKTSNKLMIAREFLITKGEMAGRVVYDNLMMTTARNMVYVRKWIEMMGYECPQDVTEISATVDAINADAADVKINVTSDQDYINAEVTALLGVSSGDSSSEKDTEEEQYTLSDLIEFCGAVGVDLTSVDLEDSSAVINELRTYAIPASTIPDGKRAMLTAIGLEDIIAEEDQDETESKGSTEQEQTVDPNLDKLVQFCIGQGIDYEADDEVEHLIERIDQFSYPKEKLTEDEINLLKEVGLSSDIIETPPTEKKKLPLAAKKTTIVKDSSVKKPITTGKKLPPRKKLLK